MAQVTAGVAVSPTTNKSIATNKTSTNFVEQIVGPG
jgi:hypothetical protein